MDDVVYVETHGTGTTAGDPQEVDALTASFFATNRQTPLLVGSVKSNIGHSESNSGMAEIAKVLIAMEQGVIPGNLHYNNPKSSLTAIIDGRIQVTRTNVFRLENVLNIFRLFRKIHPFQMVQLV